MGFLKDLQSLIPRWCQGETKETVVMAMKMEVDGLKLSDVKSVAMRIFSSLRF